MFYPSLRFNTRRGHSRPSIVFTDDACLRLDWRNYWERARCPHVFWGTAAPPSPPPGWLLRTHCFNHSVLGGATTASYHVSLYIRPEFASDTEKLPHIAQRPWSAIAASLSNRVATRSVPIPSLDALQPMNVPCQLPDGSFGSWGLFPADSPRCLVTMPCHRSPSGWGQRRLTPAELADLWNAPISLVDVWDGANCGDVLRSLTLSAPAKILSAGADYLLSCYIRGGFAFFDRSQPVAGVKRSMSNQEFSGVPFKRDKPTCQNGGRG